MLNVALLMLLLIGQKPTTVLTHDHWAYDALYKVERRLLVVKEEKPTVTTETRQEFAQAIKRTWQNRSQVGRLDAETRQLLVSLLKEFAPELKTLSMNPDAMQKTLLEEGRPFSDVPVSHWAEAAVERLYREGIVIGYPATKR